MTVMSTDQIDRLLKTLTAPDGDPSIRLLLAQLRAAQGVMPSVLLSDTIEARSFPYPAPLPMSFADAQNTFSAVNAVEPINANISGSISGNGAIAINLPAGGIDLGYYSAFRVVFSIDDNTPSSEWTLSADGFFTNGRPYAFPATQFAFTSGDARRGEAIILVTKETQAGPALAIGRLANTSFPTTFLKNGAPAMAAADGLTVTIAGAPASMRTTVQLATRVTDIYALLQDMLFASIINGTRDIRAAAPISRVIGADANGSSKALQLAKMVRGRVIG